MKSKVLTTGLVVLLLSLAVGPLGSTAGAEFGLLPPENPVEEANGLLYQRIDIGMTWHDARDYCASLGAHLVTISSLEENQLVYDLLPWGWLGGTDEDNEGVWRWVTGEPWVFINWYPGEPNNCCLPEHCGGVGCTPEHYLSFWGAPPVPQWNDLPNRNKSFVCEWEALQVAIDINPQSCPNPLNIGGEGVLPIAILGTEGFDVTQVDPPSVELEGVAPLRWALEDVATPFEPFIGKEDAYDCTEQGPDGDLDLTLNFKAQEVVAALGEVQDGDVLVLQLTGNLMEDFGGTPIAGEDVVWILKK